MNVNWSNDEAGSVFTTHSIDGFLLPIIYHFIWQFIVWIRLHFIHNIIKYNITAHCQCGKIKMNVLPICILHLSLKWLFSNCQPTCLIKKTLQTTTYHHLKFQLLKNLSRKIFPHLAWLGKRPTINLKLVESALTFHLYF